MKPKLKGAGFGAVSVLRHGSILKNSNVVRIKVRCRNTPRYLLDIHNRVFEGRDDDTLGTAVELSQEIMNKIMSEAGNSERFFCFLLSYSNCLLGMFRKQLSSTYVTVTPLYLLAQKQKGCL